MARAYRFDRRMRLEHVIIPQLAPFIAAAARTGLSLILKIVLVVELLGRPNGVGFEIGTAFQLFDVARILVYAPAFVAVIVAIKYLLVRPIERRVSRWRPRTSRNRNPLASDASGQRCGGRDRARPAAVARCRKVGTVLGPSGCGMITLHKCVAGLDSAYDGRLAMPGPGRLGIVFQEPRLLPWRTVAENIRLPSPDARRQDIDQLIGMLHLSEHRRHYPCELSLGLARRVSIARAFGFEPDLLLLDEQFV